jgi:hypothetical protein
MLSLSSVSLIHWHISSRALHASAWLIPKNELYANKELQEKEGWGRQHGGKSGKEDSWLIVPSNKPPVWLGKFGGNIDNIQKVFKRLLG